MSERWPTIRVYDERGVPRLREGLVLSFYMRRAHREVGPAVLRALERYRSAILPEHLEMSPINWGDWDYLDDKAWAQIRGRLLDTSPGSCGSVKLAQASRKEGFYCFEYHGWDFENPEFTNIERYTSGVLFYLPTQYLEQHGPGVVRALALELGAELPFSFGYTSLSFLSPDGMGDEGRDKLHEVYRHYPGLDIHDFSIITDTLGSKARGAYWLTFLGQTLLGQLGGVEALRQRLSSTGISFQPLPGERLLLTLGEWPEATETAQDLASSPYRQLARVLEPFLCEEPISYYGLSAEEIRQWLRRYLE